MVESNSCSSASYLNFLKLASKFLYSEFNSVVPLIFLDLCTESELTTISLTLILESSMTQDSKIEKCAELPVSIGNPEICFFKRNTLQLNMGFKEISH